MVDDSAFVWQQPPRRRTSAAREPSAGLSTPGPSFSAPIRWVTVRDAAEGTGVPASTVRNWARKDRIASRLEERPGGAVRLVDLDEVVSRARELGRLQAPARGSHLPPQPPTAASTRELPEGSMLVPIDAWKRMLNQLGNLHEAGQQLAEARERAARAETEAMFLRERLAEMRRRAEQMSAQPPSDVEPTKVDGPAVPEPSAPASEPLWAYLYRRWSSRRGQRR